MERKSYGFKAALENNTMSGGPSVIGNLDEGQDVVFPGAFKPVLSTFLKRGFIAFGHEWDDLPIAFPVVAREEGRLLYSEARFHSTQAAQDARTVASERLDAGLEVPLSIGFVCAEDGCKYFDSGEMLLMWAREKGYDMSLFDTKGIDAWKGWCRGIVKIGELFEWSYVNAAMNRDATAMDCKRVWTKEYAEQNAWHPGTEVKTEVVVDPIVEPQPQNIRELEKLLRDEGLSLTKAKEVISQAKTLLRDVASGDATVPTEPVEVPANDGETDAGEVEQKLDDAVPAEAVEDPTPSETPEVVPEPVEEKTEVVPEIVTQPLAAGVLPIIPEPGSELDILVKEVQARKLLVTQRLVQRQFELNASTERIINSANRAARS